jgi:hypothetical protein
MSHCFVYSFSYFAHENSVVHFELSLSFYKVMGIIML